MTYPATTYAEGVELTITSGNQLHEIINGDATEEINTESGMVPSVRKALADSMLFKPAIAWAEGSVESDPFQTRLYGEGIYWAPAASNETPISMGTNPNIDGNWFLAPVTGFDSIASNTNLLSNHNFIIKSPDDITHPNVTPTDYVAGTQVFSGVFVGDDIVGLTYIDGRVSWTSGTLYFSVANSGALEYVDPTGFVASVADFDGKPRTRGVSFALVGDEYRVTVGVDALEDESANETLLGSVKFEQGIVATMHESEALSSRNLSDYTNITYKASGGKSAVDNMVDDFNANPLMREIGVYISTGGTKFQYVDSTGPITAQNFRAFDVVSVLDFGVNGIEKGVIDATSAFEGAIDYVANRTDVATVFVQSGTYLVSRTLIIPDNVSLIGASDSNYAQFDNPNKASLLFTSDWCVEIPASSRPVVIKHLDMQGDWSNSGIKINNAVREVHFEDVSIKRVVNGIYTDDCWFTRFEGVSVQPSGVGFDWAGGGTTVIMENCIVQGDSRGNSGGTKPADIGFRFYKDPASGGGFSTTTVTMTGCACQDATVGLYIGNNQQITLTSFDFEDIFNELVIIDGGAACNLTFIGCAFAVLSSNVTTSIFKFTGTITKWFNLELINCKMNTNYQDGINWGPLKFFRSESATFEDGARISISQDMEYIRDYVDIDLLPIVEISRSNPMEYMDEILVVGNGTDVTYRIPFAKVNALWGGCYTYNSVDEEYGFDSSKVQFGAGQIYKLSTANAGLPRQTLMYLRTASGSEAIGLEDLTSTGVTATLEAASSEIEVTLPTANSIVTISRG